MRFLIVQLEQSVCTETSPCTSWCMSHGDAVWHRRDAPNNGRTALNANTSASSPGQYTIYYHRKGSRNRKSRLRLQVQLLNSKTEITISSYYIPRTIYQLIIYYYTQRRAKKNEKLLITSTLTE